MELTEHRPGNHYFIRDINEQGVRVNETRYATSILVGAHLLDPDWPVSRLDQLDEKVVAAIAGLGPEVVIIGVEQSQALPCPRILQTFLGHGIGAEIMTLDAACRTFNVLMSEDRRALAGLIWPTPCQPSPADRSSDQ